MNYDTIVVGAGSAGCVLAGRPARPMGDAHRIADREQIRWTAAGLAFDESDACPLPALCGTVPLGSMVERKHELGASIRQAHHRGPALTFPRPQGGFQP